MKIWFLIRFKNAMEDFEELPHKIGENCNSEKKHKCSNNSLLVRNWIIIAKTNSWQTCDCEINDCDKKLLITKLFNIPILSILKKVYTLAAREELSDFLVENYKEDPKICHKVHNEDELNE